MNILSVKELTVTNSAGQKLVDNVTFDIRSGEVLVILGESGCGKTMTCMSVLDLLPAGVGRSSGRIMLCGDDFEEHMRGTSVGTVMQAPASCFDPVYTLRTQMCDFFRSNGKKELCGEENLRRIIEGVNLDSPEEILNAYPFQLSGGMLQRVMIALTLALNPPLIIADEATSDLDRLSQKEILRLIMDSRQKDGAILAITHDLSVAESIADRIAVMKNGRILDVFDAGGLRSGDRHEYTRSLVKANADLFTNKWGENFGYCYA